MKLKTRLYMIDDIVEKLNQWYHNQLSIYHPGGIRYHLYIKYIKPFLLWDILNTQFDMFMFLTIIKHPYMYMCIDEPFVKSVCKPIHEICTLTTYIPAYVSTF